MTTTTGIKIGKHTFEGPYTSTDNLKDRSGVYAIICQNNGKNYVIDVGESAEVKTRIETHDRENCWERNCRGTLAVSVYYTPHLQQSGRMAIEHELRRQYNPACGKR